MSSLPPGFSSSGEVALDRRYRWAKAALEAGDAVEASEILRQTVAEAPLWAPAWKLFADALLHTGDVAGAGLAYEEVIRLDPEGALGAQLDLARLGALPPKDAMRQAYVAALFDDYADRFDAHLLGKLAYRGPQAVMAALREVCDADDRSLRFARVLDLGCGTGLMGEAIRAYAGELCGVDLSPLMVAKARAKLIYERLAVGELGEFLLGEPESFDLVLAADVLVYVADLAPLFSAVAARLSPRGLFAFTLQAAADAGMAPDGYILGPDNRFSHSPEHVRAAAASSGLRLARLAPAVTRQEAGRDVPGLAVVLARDED